MIHNAGRSQRARWEHTDIQVDKDLFDLNVFSIINLSRYTIVKLLLMFNLKPVQICITCR
jgi:short-subunit dehydrogenase